MRIRDCREPVQDEMQEKGATDYKVVKEAGDKIVSLMATYVHNSCSVLLDLWAAGSVGKAVNQTGMPCRVLNDKNETFSVQAILSLLLFSDPIRPV